MACLSQTSIAFQAFQVFLSGLVRLRVMAAAMLLVPVLMNPVFASPFTAADEKSVRTVIQSQLAAFAKDDATKAFSFAAPNVRQAAGSAESFMTMVREGYPVVYRPASVAFLKAEGKDDDAVQRVQMLDAAGDSWLAIYSLQRQKNKSWRITACVVVENKGRMA
ncbi:MAG: DUF4864 domain-containing protein [Pseudomonadota bacterium]